jgi:hypothetical protein
VRVKDKEHCKNQQFFFVAKIVPIIYIIRWYGCALVNKTIIALGLLAIW